MLKIFYFCSLCDFGVLWLGSVLWLSSSSGSSYVYFLFNMVQSGCGCFSNCWFYFSPFQGLIRGSLHHLQLLCFLTPFQVNLASQGLLFFTCLCSCLLHLFPFLILGFLCRYWNYLRKQTFVLESYTTNVNWIMNRALFTSHCYLSWGFVAPYIMSMIHITAALRIYIKGYSLEETSFTSGGEHTTFPF